MECGTRQSKQKAHSPREERLFCSPGGAGNTRKAGTRSAEYGASNSMQEADAALFTGKAIRMATASLVTVGWEGSHRKEVGT